MQPQPRSDVMPVPGISSKFCRYVNQMRLLKSSLNKSIADMTFTPFSRCLSFSSLSAVKKNQQSCAFRLNAFPERQEHPTTFAVLPGKFKQHLNLHTVQNLTRFCKRTRKSCTIIFSRTYEDLSFNSETGHDQNLLRLLHNVTQFVPKQTVKQWKLCQRASTCANVLIMTSLRIK